MIILGIDPGADGALALLSMAARPVLLSSWSIYGDPAPWWRRLYEALDALPRPDLVAMETPGGGGRSRGRTRGPGAMLGLGRNTGRMEGALRGRWRDVDIVDVDSGTWPGLVSVPVGKRGELGWHRVVEARTRLQVPEDWPAGMPSSMTATDARRWVARAEAGLIGMAAGRAFLGRRAA